MMDVSTQRIMEMQQVMGTIPRTRISQPRFKRNSIAAKKPMARKMFQPIKRDDATKPQQVNTPSTVAIPAQKTQW